ncbi:MAG: efflux RND transporter periplasmic adaptor subunit, partial [Thermodesulfovibrionales bacterium]
MAQDELSQLKIEKSPSLYRSTRKRIFFWITAVVLVAAAAVLWAKGIFTPAIEVEASTVSRIYPSQTYTLLNASGYVVAQRKASVASKVTGRLVSLLVEEGNRVQKGDVIARIESDDVQAGRERAAANLDVARHSLEEARAELENATITFNRKKELLTPGFVSKNDYDAAEARYKKARAAIAAAEAGVKAAEAALREADIAIEYTILRAPFDAVVLTKDADIGDIVTPIGAAAQAKAAVVSLADMGSLQIETDVSESNLHQVTVGQPCEIMLDALPSDRFRGKVHMIVPTADRTKATVLVKVSFIDRDKRILPEMSAKVAFLSRQIAKEENTPLTVIPAHALAEQDGAKYVFALRDKKAFRTPVEVGRKMGDTVEILRGLKAGDRIAVSPLEKLKDGARIK